MIRPTLTLLALLTLASPAGAEGWSGDRGVRCTERADAPDPTRRDEEPTLGGSATRCNAGGRDAAALECSICLQISPQGWWNRKWSARKHVRLTEKQLWKGAPAARVRLGTGGRVREDFADLRVLTMDKDEVPHAVVAHGPGDAVEIVFPIDGRTEWFVYHGNPGARPPKEKYVRDRGLVLETRLRGMGNPTNWTAMAEILKRSTKVYGGSSWPRVFDAHNPFGPSEHFVSIYRGFLLAPKAGTYTFFTASDEASFLFIGPRLVAQAPGWHGAGTGAWGKFKGTIELEAGLHPFRYLHVERTGSQIMAAYWQVPGAKKAVVIPAAAFPGHRTAAVVTHEVLGKKAAADFTVTAKDKWALDQRVYTGVTLTARESGRNPEYRWEFGDGVTAKGREVFHTYLRGGLYEVKLTIRASGAEDTVVRPVRITGEWTRFDRNKEPVLERMAGDVALYPGNRLAATDLARAVFLLDTARWEDESLRLLEEALRSSTLLTREDTYGFAMDLGRRYVTGPGELAPAVRAFGRAVEAGDGKFALSARVERAGAMVRLGGDHAAARRELESIVREEQVRKGSLARMAWTLLGDARMLGGNGPGAKVAYEKAELLAGGAENVRRLLRKAAATRTALSHIEKKELKQAAKALAKWEWEAPMDRYTGHHRIATARMQVGRARPDDALRELLTLVDANPESEYADRALFLAAGIEEARKNGDAAKALRERLAKDYPWSPYLTK